MNRKLNKFLDRHEKHDVRNLSRDLITHTDNYDECTKKVCINEICIDKEEKEDYINDIKKTLKDIKNKLLLKTLLSHVPFDDTKHVKNNKLIIEKITELENLICKFNK